MDTRMQKYPRRQFLAYTTTIARERPLQIKGDVDLDEELTFAQWEAERK